jgi:cysteine-rich repeat protein
MCGDGTRDPEEGCDDGNLDPEDGCSETCQVEPGCGNALLEVDEECDDGNLDDGDGCSSLCVIEVACGDGYRAASERCDDGNLFPGDGCDALCEVEPACGNAVLDEGETCDDGGTRSGDGCDDACQLEATPGVPPFDWAIGFDPGLGHGRVGGAGFRETALPVIVHVTDAVSHTCDDYAAAEISSHCAADVFYELGAIGARVIVVATFSGDDPSDLTTPLGMVTTTGAVVPLCAFDASEARLDGRCPADTCCTGLGGAGSPPNADGECPLVFRIDSSGQGLDSSITNAIDTLTQYIRYDLTTAPRDDPSDAVNALCFIESIGVHDFSAPPGSCAVEPIPVDTDGDGIDETLAHATPRTRVTFEVLGTNQDIHDVDGDGDTTESCAGAGSYGLFLDIVTDGGTVVASRWVEVEVE